MSDLTDFLLARISEKEHVGQLAPGSSVGRTVLAECEAKRRIVHIHESTAARPPKGDGYEEARSRQTLRLLALPYADHPDYRQEWRP